MGADYKMRRDLASRKRVWMCEDDSSVHTSCECARIWAPAIPDPDFAALFAPPSFFVFFF